MSISPYENYQDFLDRGGDPYRVSNANHWTDNDLAQLKELIDRKAERLEIMAAFPYRKWDYIRRKIKDIYGKSVHIVRSRGTLTSDTYFSYAERHPDMSIAGSS